MELLKIESIRYIKPPLSISLIVAQSVGISIIAFYVEKILKVIAEGSILRQTITGLNGTNTKEISPAIQLALEFLYNNLGLYSFGHLFLHSHSFGQLSIPLVPKRLKNNFRPLSAAYR